MADDQAYPALNELLGYGSESRLVLINADDAGVCHAVNEAVLDVFAAGIVQSTTVMPPAPWFMEFVRLKKRHPELHCGIHLTVTSEWDGMRWGPLAPRDKVPSLLDDEGYFFRSEHDFFERADPEHVAIEFRAQVEWAIRAGLEPTHLDSHMGAYHWDERFFEIAKQLAFEHGLCMRVGYPPRRDQLRGEGWMVPDRLVWDSYDVAEPDRAAFYFENFKRLEPGVTELLIHPGHAGPELTAMCGQTAGHRAFDLAFFTDPKIKTFLDEQGIVCVGYHHLQKLQRENKTLSS